MNILSPFEEAAAFEALWEQSKATSRTIAELLADFPNRLASELVEKSTLAETKRTLLPILRNIPDFGVRLSGDGDFPPGLKDAKYPLKILYYRGNWELAYLPSVAVVGRRHPTEEGRGRTRYLVKRLVEDGFTIVSGLARGIDTVAHMSALEFQGTTIGVIGTPLNHNYPYENGWLQDTIAKDHLLISQVPFLRYAHHDHRSNRFFFPERNITMAALTQATIIVEAGPTSGTLVQAKAALAQGRKLFILDNNFQNPALSWPRDLESQGAIRAKDYNDIRKYLPSQA